MKGWKALGMGWKDWCFVSLVLANRCDEGTRGEDAVDEGLYPPLVLGIKGGESDRLEMDGTRAGRFAIRGEGGSGGDLAAFVGGDFAACGSATRDIFAFTRITFDVGVFSSGNGAVGCTGDEHVLALPRRTFNSWDEDVLTRRSRGKEAVVGVPVVSARSRASGNGDVELLPLGRGVSFALTADPPTGDAFAIRELGGLKGEGARVGVALLLRDGEADTTLLGLRAWIVALLLTLAFGLTRGGDKEVAGCLKGDGGRGRE